MSAEGRNAVPAAVEDEVFGLGTMRGNGALACPAAMRILASSSVTPNRSRSRGCVGLAMPLVLALPLAWDSWDDGAPPSELELTYVATRRGMAAGGGGTRRKKNGWYGAARDGDVGGLQLVAASGE